MSCETDVAPKAISGTGWDWMEISGRYNVKRTFGADNWISLNCLKEHNKVGQFVEDVQI